MPKFSSRSGEVTEPEAEPDPGIAPPSEDLPDSGVATGVEEEEFEEEEIIEEPVPEPKKKTNMALILGVAAIGLLIVSKR